MAPARPVVVAIPAKDEADLIAASLRAVASGSIAPDAVVLLANNCTDETCAIAAALAPELPYALHVRHHLFPPAMANAGNARRMAMQCAAELAGPNGLLLTTDADTNVTPEWVQRNVAALMQGAELVCGRVWLDAAEAAIIPPNLGDDDALEQTLTELLDKMADRLDPDPADPWPRHTEASGASLAVTVEAFIRAGGVPAMASGEDRAFVLALARVDARIRHDPSIIVIT
jgi:glycosyltransferase involved in cell wall biosynthesis